MNTENQPEGLDPREAFIVVLTSIFFSWMPTMLVAFLFPGETETGISDFGMKVALVAGEIGLWVLPIGYLKMHQLSIRKTFRINPISQNIALTSIAIGLSMAVVVDELDRLLSTIIAMPDEMAAQLSTIIRFETGTEFILVILGAVVLASLVEETIFRGFLQQAIEKQIDVTQAIINVSVIWTIIHLNIYHSIQIFLFGILLGVLTWRCGSILPSIIIHAVNNTFAVFFININLPEAVPIYEWNGHVSPLFLIPALAIAFYGFKYIWEIGQESGS